MTAEELSWSQQFLHRLAQSQAYGLEIRQLLQNPTSALPKSSPLRNLSPFIDDTVVRMRGRLEKSTIISDATKNPIILPKNHYITSLVVDCYHRKFKHINHETVINEIFQKYHISRLRPLLRTIHSNCPMCKIQRANPRPPEMGSLPEARMKAYERPFSYVGIDFVGPFLMTVGRCCEKRYGVIFTCLTCQPVHVEVAYSLSLNSCVMAVRNFIARRGVPIHVYSDINPTNSLVRKGQMH